MATPGGHIYSLTWINDTMLSEGMILPEDRCIFTLVDTPADAVEIIRNSRVA
jgi:predicted Rossmann-fold nucleotide-binding protein